MNSIERTIFPDRQIQPRWPMGTGDIAPAQDREPDESSRIVPRLSASLCAIQHQQDVLVQLTQEGVRLIRVSIEVDAKTMGGIPVLMGTRFPVARLIQDIAMHSVLAEIADNYDLNEKDCRNFFDALAIFFDRPFAK